MGRGNTFKIKGWILDDVDLRNLFRWQPIESAVGKSLDTAMLKFGHTISRDDFFWCQPECTQQVEITVRLSGRGKRK